MKYIIALVLLSVFHFTYGQETYSLTPDFSWKKIEKRNPTLIEEFIKLTPTDEFDFYKEPEELVDVLHNIDLNNDKLDDIIFYGQISDDESSVVIYLNKGTAFKKVFAGKQSIMHMEFKNNVLSRLAVEDLGCCGEVIFRDQYFDVTAKPNGDLTFKLSKSFEYLDRTELPTTYWPATKIVKVNHDKYKMRSAPFIDDTSVQEDDRDTTKGNTIGLMPQDSEALAMAEATDSTGRVWYFVAVYPDYILTNTPFFEPKEGFRSFKCAWISSRFVATVKE
ncbi:MAG: hypothetical protein JWO58_2430 [Chitinophagaceae bacterium]|nr:hypothetical protein [Chitinophagaceae bacterium]